MFTFAATPVKFVALLVLFAWCVGWGCYELTRRQSSEQRVGNALHLAMSLLMLAMVPAWSWKPLSAFLPLWGWAALFAVATAWFVLRWARSEGRGEGVHAAACALMFFAMTWHLGGMAVWMTAMSGAAGHGGMAMAPSPGVLAVAWVGVPVMVLLLAVGLLDLVRAFRRPVPGASVAAPTCHEPRPIGSWAYRCDALFGAAMNLGMFWMSAGMLTPLLPWMGALSF